MILDKEIKIKMNGKHIDRYRSLGYKCDVGETILVKIEDLPRYSKCLINSKCDFCENTSTLNYNIYNKSIEKNGFYRCTECGRKSAKETCISKYGVDNPTKSKIISNKISLAYKNKREIEKELLVDKHKKTVFENYGGWFTNTNEYKDKIKKISLDKYGLDDYRSSDEFKNKVKKTLNEKYGVENPSQLPLSYKKSWFGNKINGIHFSGLMYQGTYELDFLEKYYDKLKIDKIKPIKYYFEDKKHYYHPDFYLPNLNLIIEIKSSYTYNFDLERNLAKKEYSLKSGYSFIFIIDKDYNEFDSLLLS